MSIELPDRRRCRRTMMNTACSVNGHRPRVRLV